MSNAIARDTTKKPQQFHIYKYIYIYILKLAYQLTHGPITIFN